MQRIFVGLRRAMYAGVVLLSLSTLCLAQQSRGSITGKVTDAQNAVVPNATVVVTNTATNVANTVKTNSTGFYQVDFLIPGPYSISAESTGFKTLVRSGVTLNTGDRLAVDLQLQVGATSTSVDVTAD